MQSDVRHLVSLFEREVDGRVEGPSRQPFLRTLVQHLARAIELIHVRDISPNSVSHVE